MFMQKYLLDNAKEVFLQHTDLWIACQTIIYEGIQADEVPSYFSTLTKQTWVLQTNAELSF